VWYGIPQTQYGKFPYLIILFNKDVPVEDRRNSFINLALPMIMFSEPLPPLWVEDKEYDEIMMGPVKAVPGKFSVWDKTHLKGPLTIG